MRAPASASMRGGAWWRLCGCWAGGGGGGGVGDEKREGTESAPTSWNLFIELGTLEVATDNFSDANLLGRGGFGPVYKGVLENGEAIAVKKLSLESRQGVKEFINEVRLLLKIQHRNLVSLLGCCASSGQKMLVYPYFPNRSLDHFLFDKKKSVLLDWSKRFEIIVGVAKGLLYLHEESPVKIIHRDIKASNILLDDQLNPKISDFGMARLFLEDDTHVNTFRISGTYGYMAPEYAMNGYLSAKTDVFSFGMLVLEIVSGRKNIDRHLDEEKIDLLNYTWKLSEEGRASEIMDPTLSECDADEVLLCIQIGLLCCQAIVSDRPDMNSVHLMLCSGSFTLPKPGRPAIHGRVGRWSTTSSTAMSSNTNNTNSTFGTTDTTKASNLFSVAEEYSRNSISVSFTSEGR
ncbi:putative receptor-like protein kinase At4g00960 [Ananas comosus]|uniref:Receptor-like protein kinase At4g00960 n=1 Tax=Ananas comosus TaxID=4615 RepID=A0A6P5FQL0_ANACO|nr:putative receptor-like protein kinase At4g00960 [Ananas comosus]